MAKTERTFPLRDYERDITYLTREGRDESSRLKRSLSAHRKALAFKNKGVRKELDMYRKYPLTRAAEREYGEDLELVPA